MTASAGNGLRDLFARNPLRSPLLAGAGAAPALLLLLDVMGLSTASRNKLPISAGRDGGGSDKMKESSSSSSLSGSSSSKGGIPMKKAPL